MLRPKADGSRWKVQGQGRPSKVRLRGQGDQEGSGGWVQRREGEQRRGTKKTKGPGLGAGENRTEGHEGREQRDTTANRARPATRTGTTRVPAPHPSVHAGAPHTGGHEENKKTYPSLREGTLNGHHPTKGAREPPEPQEPQGTPGTPKGAPTTKAGNPPHCTTPHEARDTPAQSPMGEAKPPPFTPTP